ncbi:probable UDP-N-acetylglucosamine--peptide N-acetylglucosaminyltransferase SPINDLY isoform X1 [Tanacetum coccineum]
MMVIEATGTLGRQVVGRILDEGYDVQCLVSPRPPRADFLHDWDATFVNLTICTKLALPEMDVGGGIGEGQVESNGFVKSSELSIGFSNFATSACPIGTTYKGNEALGYANILRSRNKFMESLCIYESVLEKDNRNVDAHIGKGIFLKMQNMGRQAFESFSEAVKLDPQNA